MNTNNNFCHLHLHSMHSYLDGYGSPIQYISKIKEMGMKYAAITDHGNVDGVLNFQRECIKQGINPIIGCEVYIVEDANIKKQEKRGHIVILIKNIRGWTELCRLLTKANLDGFYHRPRIGFNDLLSADLSGFVILTACMASFINLPGGLDTLLELQEKMPNRLFLEIEPHDFPEQYIHNEKILELHNELNIPLIATNDCHYIDEDDWETQEVLLAIGTKAKWSNKKRFKFSIKGLHLRSAREMQLAFRKHCFRIVQINEAMANTVKVAKICSDFRIPKQEMSLPAPYEDKNDDKTLYSLCHDGFKRFYNNSKDIPKEYSDRLEQEFRLIKKKKFARYFMIFYDIIQWCHNNNIPVGPGRGSVSGSLIAYLIGITKVDPIKFHLSFARFITDDRIDYPDIDVDFAKKDREKVREYICNKYGLNYTCGISTDMKLKSRAAVQAVARVFEVSEKDIRTFSKSIWQGGEENLQRAIDETDEGKYFAKKYPKVIHFALKIENTVRGQGQHAAALIISNEDLTKGTKCVLIRRKDRIVCNWNMEDSEYVGLMKLDILGLSTLSVEEEAENLINKGQEIIPSFWYHPESECYFVDKDVFSEKVSRESIDNIDLNLDKIPLDDQKVFDLINSGKTAGIFQISAKPTTELCKEMKINNFEDISAAVSLVRPGPTNSGMTKKYIQRKHGKKWKPMHPIYEEVTKHTYGILVYQEQVMQVISKVAGLPESTADRIRKVIGKKRTVKEFKPYWEQFRNGCKKMKTLSLKEAKEFWEGLLEWASYGFNRCLTGDTLLTRSSYNQYTGKHISIEDLYLAWHSNTPAGDKYRRQGLQILQMNDDNRCRPGKIIGIFYQGKEIVYKITTKTGKEIKGTYNHKLFTFDGYKKITDLKNGDRLAIMAGYQESITERKGQKWKKTNTKGKKGFQKREDNPAYIDGRSILFEKSKQLILSKVNNKCEHCLLEKINNAKFEFAHIRSIKECNDDWELYHSENNILYLCNSCHKKLDYQKGERKKRYSKGYPIYYDPIISIEAINNKEVFDIEMEGPFHNFVANDIVSHNSHSIAYSLIGYQTAWLKANYPIEFICAALSFADYDDNKSEDARQKKELLEEIMEHDITIMPPKVGLSDPIKWLIKDNKLYVPFIEIMGFGEQQANKSAKSKEISKPKLEGFFGKEYAPPVKEKSKNDIILDELKAYDSDKMPDDKVLLKYLPFNIGKTDMIYNSLKKVLGFDFSKHVISRLKILDLHKEEVPKGLIQRIRFSDINLLECNECELRKECDGPVMPSLGIYNAVICGEGPGPQENEHKRGFYEEAPAGELLWSELGLYGLNRRMFHTTNCIKCYPSLTKTPKEKHIKACAFWLSEELKNLETRLILAFGNTSVKAFTGRDGGITNLSGSTEFIPALGLWVAWCIHPAAVKRKGSNKEYFEKGIKNFAQKFELLKGKKCISSQQINIMGTRTLSNMQIGHLKIYKKWIMN